METRKVQLSGGTTYTVSLPKNWAEEHGIEAGSSLSLYPNGDGSMLIEALDDRPTDTRSATIEITNDSETAIKQWIHALYAVGFDEVTLVDESGFGPERHGMIETAVKTFSGFELMEAGDTRTELRSLIDAENVDVRKSTLRLRLVVLGMHRDAVSAVLNGDQTLAQRVIDRDDEADKLFAMVTRHYRRALTNLHEVEKLGYDREELVEFHYLSRQFERIADHAEKIARFAIDPEVTIPAEFKEQIDTMAAQARTIADDAADVILADAHVNESQRALEARDELVQALQGIDRKLYDHETPLEAYVVGMLVDSIRRTGEYGANIANMAVQQVARKSASSRLPPR